MSCLALASPHGQKPRKEEGEDHPKQEHGKQAKQAKPTREFPKGPFPMTQAVRQAWLKSVKETLEESKKQFEERTRNYKKKKPSLNFPDLPSWAELTKDVEQRECHWIERFCIGISGDIQTVFEGDVMPDEVRLFLEERQPIVGDAFKKLNEMDRLLERCESREQADKVTWNSDIGGIISALSHCDLSGQDLRGAHLQGDLLCTYLTEANLCGADLEVGAHGARLTGANLSGARGVFRGAFSHLDRCLIRGASLRIFVEFSTCEEVRLDGSALEARFAFSKMRHASLVCADLQNVDLSGTELEGALLSGSDISAATWRVPPVIPTARGIQVTALPPVSFVKKASGFSSQGFLQGLGHAALRAFWGSDGDGEDSDDEGDDADSDEEEDAVDEKADDQQDGTGFGDVLLQEVEEQSYRLLDQGASALGSKIDASLSEALKQAEQHVGRVMTQLDAAAKPQAAALLKVLRSNKFQQQLQSAPSAQKVLQSTLRMLSNTSGGKFMKAFRKFEAGLQSAEEGDFSQFIMKLGDSHLQAQTGYTSAQLLGFLRFSRAQMAADKQELEDILDYVAKLQDTVNKNNWDDVVDNFVCLYDLRARLTGERSRQVFKDIWKGDSIREKVAVGVVFQEVSTPDKPPDYVIHEVKDAVQIVKKHAVPWRKALNREIAAIELAKTKQEQFFAFMISVITGVFMFVASFFSGLALDAVRDGTVSIPFLSDTLFQENSTVSSL